MAPVVVAPVAAPASTVETTPTTSVVTPTIVATTATKAPGKLSTRVLEKEKEKAEAERKRRAAAAAAGLVVIPGPGGVLGGVAVTGGVPGGVVDLRDAEPSEPTMMICPETGVLIPMQEAEEGQYVPVAGGGAAPEAQMPKQPSIIVSKASTSTQSEMPATWQSQPVPVKPLQSLKQHVLQQAKQEQQAQVLKTVVHGKPVQLAPQDQPTRVVVNPMPANPMPTAQAAKVCVVQPDTKINVNVVPPQVPQKPRDMILKAAQAQAQTNTNAVPLMAPGKLGVLPAGMAPGKPAVPVMNQMSSQPMNPKMHLLQAAATLQQGQQPANLTKVNQVAAVQVGAPLNKPATVTPLTPKAHILNAVVNQAKTTAPMGVALPQPVGVVVQPATVSASTAMAQNMTHKPLTPQQAQGQAVGVKANAQLPLSLVQPAKTNIHLVHGGQQQPQPYTGITAVASPPLHKPGQVQPVAGAGATLPGQQAVNAVGYRAVVPQAKPQGDAAHPYPSPHLVRAVPPGVAVGPHDLSHAHPAGTLRTTQYVHPTVMYQYLRSQGLPTDGILPYHLPAAASASASGGVVPPSRSPIVPKTEPDLEEAMGPVQGTVTVTGRGSAAPPGSSPPLELRRPASAANAAAVTTVAHSLQSPHAHDAVRATDSPLVATVYRMPHYGTAARYYPPADEPPPAHVHAVPSRPGVGAQALHAGSQQQQQQQQQPAAATTAGAEAPVSAAARPALDVASQVPPQHDSLLMLLQRYPVMWQGLLALKNDQAAVQMHFVFGNPVVARGSLPCNGDGTTPPLRIAQRMRLEQTQIDGVTRKMQTENEHCMLLALPCGRDTMDVLQQSNNLQTAFITYLQQKQAAGIVNIAAPGSQQAAYVVHVFPSCEFANESLARIAPDLFHRVANLAHLVIIIATV